MSLFLKRLSFFFSILLCSIASAQDMQMIMQTGHSLPVTNMVFSNDGNYLLSTSKGVIKIWDAVNARELKSITMDEAVEGMIMLSDSTAAIMTTEELRIVDLKSGVVMSSWTSSSPTTSIDYSTSKRSFVVGTSSGKVHLLTYEPGLEAVASFDVPEFCTSVRFSVTSDSIFVAGTKGLSIVRTSDGSEIKQLPNIIGARNLAIAGHNKLLFQNKETVSIVDIGTESLKMEAYGDRKIYSFNAVDVSSGAHIIVASNTTGYVYVWTSSGRLITDKFFSKAIVSVEAHPTRPIVMLGGTDGIIWTFDIATEEFRQDLKSTALAVASVSFIDQRKSFSVIQGSNLRVYDFEGPLQIRDLTGTLDEKPSYKEYLNASASIGKDQLLTAGGDNRLRLWNVATGHEEAVGQGPRSKFFWLATPAIVGYLGSFYNTAFAPFLLLPLKARAPLSYLAVNEQRTIAIPGAITGTVRTFSLPSFKSQKIKPFFMMTAGVSLNADGTRASTVGESGFGPRTLKVFDLTDIKKEKNIWTTIENVDYKTVSAIHPTKTEVAYDNGKEKISYVDYATGSRLKELDGYGPLKFGPDHSSLFFQTSDFSIASVDATTFEKKATFSGHSNTVSSIDFAGDKLITGSADGTARIWDVKTGKELATVVSLPDNNFILKTPDNYYYCSKSALKLVSFTKELKFFPFEQFDLQYNRPDIVLERLGMTSEELIHAYRRAYAKRLKKMNFTEEVFSKDFHLPELTVRRPPSESTQRTLELHVTAEDSRYKLDRINVYINNVPLHGTAGIDLKSRSTQHTSQTIPVELNRGKNQVLVTVHNEKGVESLGETFEVQYTGNTGKPNLYVLAIGVSKYQQSAMDLTYAAKDAQDFANLIVARKNKFENIFIDTLLNEKATLQNILQSAAKLKQTNVDDHVIVFIAGHGLLNNDLDYYVATHDIDFSKPEDKGLAYEKLDELLMTIPARNKVLLMDACHSGEVDKEEVMLVTANAEKVEDGQIQFRAVNSKVVPRVGLQNSFELMKHLFADLRRGSGTSVVSSAGGAEYAMEGKEWKNGIFTYCLVSGLKDSKADLDDDGKVMLSELQKYLQVEVPRLTSGKQTPTSRAENLYNDVEIW